MCFKTYSFFAPRTFPANIPLDEDVLKTSFVFFFRRRLEKVFKTYWSRRICSPSLTSSEDVFKMSWSRTINLSWPYVFKTSSRRLRDVLPRRLQDILQKRLQDIFKTSCQDVFKTSSKRLQGNVLKNVFKTSSRRLQEVLQRYLQDVFKRYHQVKLFLLTRLWEAFNTFLRRSFPMTIINRGICLGNITSDKFMVSV